MEAVAGHPAVADMAAVPHMEVAEAMEEAGPREVDLLMAEDPMAEVMEEAVATPVPQLSKLSK
jgi:hypothetical protein